MQYRFDHPRLQSLELADSHRRRVTREGSTDLLLLLGNAKTLSVVRLSPDDLQNPSYLICFKYFNCDQLLDFSYRLWTYKSEVYKSQSKLKSLGHWQESLRLMDVVGCGWYKVQTTIELDWFLDTTWLFYSLTQSIVVDCITRSGDI